MARTEHSLPEPLNILLIRLSSLGDIVLTTPAIRALRERYPDARIDYVVGDRFVGALSQHPEIGRLLVFPKRRIKELWKSGQIAALLREISRFVRELRKKAYDYVIDLHNVTDSALIALFADGRIKAGHRRQLLSLPFKVRASFDDGFASAEMHAAESALMFLVESGCLDLRDLPPEPHLDYFLPPSAAGEVDLFLESHGLAGKGLVGINPCGSYPFKRWHEERFAAVGDWLHAEYGAAVIIFGSPAEQDIVRRVMGRMGTAAVDSSHLTLFQAFELIRRLALFVTNDSAPMHVAAAFDTPTVALHGPINSRKFHPLSQNAIGIGKELACLPCRRPRDCARRDCWDLVSVEEVCGACRDLIRKLGLFRAEH